MTRSALTQGWVRLARAGVLGAASLFLGTAGHVVGGGTLPGAGLLALTGVALALIAVSLAARRMRFGALLIALSVEQLTLHLVFHAATAAASCAAVSMPGHTMSAPVLCGSGTASTGGWSMLLGHAVAVVATAWLLAHGERWLWRTVERAHAYAAARPSRWRRRAALSIAFLAAWLAVAGRLSVEPRAPPLS